MLDLDVMRPSKVKEFEAELETKLQSGRMKSEADVIRFCIEAGMTSRHAAPVLRKLKTAGTSEIDFRVPEVRNMKSPRPIRTSK